MAGFRGDDATLEREIAATEALARVRLRRAAQELRELERDLRALKAERARRRGAARSPTGAPEGVAEGA